MLMTFFFAYWEYWPCITTKLFIKLKNEDLKMLIIFLLFVRNILELKQHHNFKKLKKKKVIRI